MRDKDKKTPASRALLARCSNCRGNGCERCFGSGRVARDLAAPGNPQRHQVPELAAPVKPPELPAAAPEGPPTEPDVPPPAPAPPAPHHGHEKHGKKK